VIGVSLGVTLDIKGTEPVKKLPDTTTTVVTKKDKDGDGIEDKDDDCPKDFGTAATKGCPDKDGDGVADKDDKCPDVKGLISNKGCPAPDADGDGVADADDKCPNEKGSILNNGCPVATEPVGDKDGDGIMDDKDKCPDVKGFLRYDGCPIPDTDGDGINDELDKCKDVPGTRAKRGCPETEKPENNQPVSEEIVTQVNEKAGKIQFKQSSFVLTADAMSALDDVATLMHDNPNMKLDIEGHASQEGDNYVNLGLSNSRANAVRNYLASKGIDKSRMRVTYFGANKPLDASNPAANRRVELKPHN
jgi:outer membrane protein OmpA-like peptidoglycan-associated protein